MYVGTTAQTDKSYPRDNRLIAPNSSHRRGGLAPRCRLITSWRGSTFQGYGCSPFKVVRELGSERKLHCVLLPQGNKVSINIESKTQILTKIGETPLRFRTISRAIPRVSAGVMPVWSRRDWSGKSAWGSGWNSENENESLISYVSSLISTP